ncbi:hypothetical protein [Halosimplex sp. J119]
MADSASATDASDGASRVRHWVFLDGNRLLITGLVSVGIFALTRALVAVDLLAIGPKSSVPTTFGSGVTAGVFTLITLILTVNQLISSQVFGGPASLQSRYEKGEELRDSVADLAGRTTVPVESADFAAAIGSALDDRAESLRESARNRTDVSDDDLASLARGVSTFADGISGVSADMEPIDVVSATAGSDYARLRSEVRAVATANELPNQVDDDLDAIVELIGHLSVFRQLYKTFALHQELAKLSRQIMYVSVPCLLVALYVPMLYRSNAVTVPRSLLPWLLSGAVAVVLVPLVLLVVRLLRVSTVMRYTVSVAPFAPPDDWPWNE